MIRSGITINELKRILRNELRKEWIKKFPKQKLLIDCGSVEQHFLILTPKGKHNKRSKYLDELCASLYYENDVYFWVNRGRIFFETINPELVISAYINYAKLYIKD